MLCPRAGVSLQTLEPRVQFCPKGRSSTANSGTKVTVLRGINKCGSFPLLSAPHSLSLFSIWTDLKRSENIPEAPTRLNISSIRVFDLIMDPEIPITLRPHIQSVTGPHRQNDRDDGPCREDQFLWRNIYSQTCRSWVMRMYQGGTNWPSINVRRWYNDLCSQPSLCRSNT